MKITFLGQAGLLLENDRATVLIDPYFSDHVKTVEPENYRRQPIDERFFSVKPDFVLFTHNHLDHYDPETAPKFLNEKSHATVLSPRSVWEVARKLGGPNNYVLFDRGAEWTEKGLHFKAVTALHSDPYAIGFVIEDGENGYYITGDTLYQETVFSELPPHITAVFLPINGVGNNMNMADAARFAKRCKAEKVVPLHFGMFDSLDPNDFVCENTVIPTLYQEVTL